MYGQCQKKDKVKTISEFVCNVEIFLEFIIYNLFLHWQLTRSALEVKIMSVLFFKRFLMEVMSSKVSS